MNALLAKFGIVVEEYPKAISTNIVAVNTFCARACMVGRSVNSDPVQMRNISANLRNPSASATMYHLVLPLRYLARPTIWLTFTFVSTRRWRVVGVPSPTPSLITVVMVLWELLHLPKLLVYLRFIG